jgi:hypothetical protein
LHQNKADSIGVSVRVEPRALMRMLAKIAHAGAMAHYGAHIERPLLPRRIGAQETLV